MTVLDLSNYDLSTFSGPCLKSAGVERVIIGCWDLAASRAIARGALDAGIIVEDLYTFLYYGLAHETREVSNALALAREMGTIKRIWLDCEAHFDPAFPTETADMTVAYRFAATRTARQLVEAAGLRAGIYTGAYWWPSKMGNTAKFADLPLWVANYGANDPDNPRPPLTQVAFGGWTKPAVHQYSSTIPVCGRNRDHNYWMLEEDEMSAADIARLDRLEQLLGANGIAKDPAAYIASGYDPAHLTFGEEALAYAVGRGWSVMLGVGLARAEAATSNSAIPAGTKFTITGEVTKT